MYLENLVIILLIHQQEFYIILVSLYCNLGILQDP